MVHSERNFLNTNMFVFALLNNSDVSDVYSDGFKLSQIGRKNTVIIIILTLILKKDYIKRWQ